MAETQSAPSLRELSEAATQGEWTYPDWGTDFRTGKTLVGMTSPAFDGNGRANRAFIVALVNAFRAGRLIDPTTLTEAVAAARAEGVREGLERAGSPHSKDFQLMLVRIIQRHRNGRDLTDTLKGAEDLLKRKGSLSVFREPAPPTTPGGRTDG